MSEASYFGSVLADGWSEFCRPQALSFLDPWVVRTFLFAAAPTAVHCSVCWWRCERNETACQRPIQGHPRQQLGQIYKYFKSRIIHFQWAFPRRQLFFKIPNSKGQENKSSQHECVKQRSIWTDMKGIGLIFNKNCKPIMVGTFLRWVSIRWSTETHHPSSLSLSLTQSGGWDKEGRGLFFGGGFVSRKKKCILCKISLSWRNVLLHP